MIKAFLNYKGQKSPLRRTLPAQAVRRHASAANIASAISIAVRAQNRAAGEILRR